MKTSQLFTLNYEDFAKGFVVATGGAALAAVETCLQAGSWVFDWKAIGSVALTAGLSYLAKNFFTSAQFVTPIK